jgi:hypothetical protein
VYEHSEIVDQLKEFRIVRAVNGQYYKAKETLLPESEEQNEIVSLPCLIFIDPAVLSSMGEELLKKIGASSFSEETVIERILDSQSKDGWKSWSVEERLRAISHIADWIKKSDYSVKDEKIKSKLGNLILPIEGNGWSIASVCYFPVPELKELFPDGKFVDLQTLESLVDPVERFLWIIGVLKFPRVLSLGDIDLRKEPNEISKEDWKGYCKWLSEGGHREYSTGGETISVTCLDGFSGHVSSHDATKMEKYLNFLLNHWQEYYKSYGDSKYSWFYYRPDEKEIPSYFVYRLKKCTWLPTSEGLRSAKDTFAPLREIRLVGRNLLPYLNVSEEQARENKEFLRFLGIETEINLQMLLSILKRAKDVEVNEVLKKQLSRVYQKMADLLESEKIEEAVSLLTTDDSFVLSQELHWMDDPGAEEVFRGEIPAAWVPENLSRPDIETFFGAFGVAKISSILRRQMVKDSQEVIGEPRWTACLQKSKDFLYSILLHHRASGAERFPDFIKKVMVAKTDRLRLQLAAMDKVHEIETPCFCSIEEGKIYISLTAQSMDVARELVRAFGASRGSEFTLNFVFQSPDNILDEFEKSSIQLVTLPEIEASLEIAMPLHIKTIEDKLREPPEFQTQTIPSPQDARVEGLEVKFDMNTEDIKREIKRARELLNSGASSSYESSNIWAGAKEIERVTSNPRATVQSLVSYTAEKNWEPRFLEGEKVFIEVGIEPEKIEASRLHVKPFRQRMRKIVEIMGGNPDTVNVCIAYTITDGDRRENQLFFNVLRDDKPLRWIVVVARELAYLKYPKLGPAHISLMTDLIEKALEKIYEIYPEELKS